MIIITGNQHNLVSLVSLSISLYVVGKVKLIIKIFLCLDSDYLW
jgi:hypothetical protein